MAGLLGLGEPPNRPAGGSQESNVHSGEAPSLCLVFLFFLPTVNVGTGRLCIARATNIESIVWTNIHLLVDCPICLFGPTQFQLAHGQAHACEAGSWKLMHVRRRWLAVMTHKIIRVVIWPDTCMHMQNFCAYFFFCSVLYSFPSCSFFTFIFPMLSQIFLL